MDQNKIERIVRSEVKILTGQTGQQPRSCTVEMIRLIVRIRKKIGLDRNFQRFDHLIQKRYPILAAELNHRWINSVADTYTDHGSEEQKAQAIILSQFMVSISAIRAHHKMVARYKTDVHQMRRDNFRVIWCDKFSNFFARIDRQMHLEPFLSFWRRIRNDLDHDNTDWSYLAGYNVSGFYRRLSTYEDIPAFANQRKAETMVVIGNDYHEFVELFKPFEYPKQIQVIGHDQLDLVQRPINLAYITRYYLIDQNRLLSLMAPKSTIIGDKIAKNRPKIDRIRRQRPCFFSKFLNTNQWFVTFWK